MIGFLRGEILDHSEGRVLVTMGGLDGAIGYLVAIPHHYNDSSLMPGKKIELYIYTHVREDALDLYGFYLKEEKELFLCLLSVTGIGPKGALGILSRVTPEVLIQAILEQDKDALLEIPGIGKKTAERVVLELGDTIRKRVEEGTLGLNKMSAGKKMVSSMVDSKMSTLGNVMLRDAKDALVGLGYREQEVIPLLKNTLESEPPPRRVEDLIRTALQQLA